jgi:hypothetical protein
MPERIVAIGLLTRSDLTLLGNSIARLWPVDETPCFTGLLKAIDQADRQLEAIGDACDQHKRAEMAMPDPVR